MSRENITMSKTVISSAVAILVSLLPLIGVNVGSEQLTEAVQTIIVVVSGVVIWFERVRKGDVSVVGKRV